jgi:hypothetical protein
LVVISAFASSTSCRASRDVCSLSCSISAEIEASSALVETDAHRQSRR